MTYKCSVPLGTSSISVLLFLIKHGFPCVKNVERASNEDHIDYNSFQFCLVKPHLRSLELIYDDLGYFGLCDATLQRVEEHSNSKGQSKDAMNTSTSCHTLDFKR